MSDDLKTLKDFEEFILVKETKRLKEKGDKLATSAWGEKPSWCDQEVYGIFWELRAEAIKHCNNIAKECWFKNAAEYIEKKQGQDTSDACGLHIIEWIMRFFNISEKDIKRSVEG